MDHTEWAFFSYNNHNLALALRLGQDLMSKGFGLWFDHLSIAPSVSWADTVSDKQNKSQAAIVLLSAAYFASQYCIEELNQFQQQNATIIALCLDTTSLEEASQNAHFVAVLDFRQHIDETDYLSCLASLEIILSELQFFAATISEERAYLLEVIMSLELALSQTMTGRLAAQNDVGISWQGRKLRPRCHAPAAWLLNGQFSLYEASPGANTEQSSHLVLSNIIEWLEWRSRMMIVGKAATGKTTVLQYTCLATAFRRLEAGIVAPLPLYIDLAEWQAKDSILSFVKQTWPLNSDVEALLQRGGVMLFVDGLGEIPYPNERVHQEIEKLFDIETVSSLIITAREEVIDFDLPPNLSFVQIAELQESQTALITASVLTDAELPLRPYKIESLAVGVLSQTTTPEAHDLPWQQQLKYVVPALWEQIALRNNNRFTLSNLRSRLEAFASLSYELGEAIYYPHQTALQAMGDDLLLQLAINLGILKRSANGFRFVSSSLRLYLAASKLLEDGVYCYLTHPRFDADGQRLPQNWDKVILFAIQLIPADDIPLFIQIIADVDPYLAFQCAEGQVTLLPATVRDIVGKLLEPRRKALRSLSLSKQVIRAFNDKDLLVNILVEVMQAKDWSRSELAFEFLRDLPIPDSDKIVQAIDTIEPDFPDSVYSALEGFTGSKPLALLCQLAINGKLPQRIRAIYTLGELVQPIGAIVLNQLNMEESASVLLTATSAIAKLNHKQNLPFLYALIHHSDAQLVQAAEQSLIQIDAGIKTAILQFLRRENALNQSLTQSLLAISDETLSQILAYVLGNLGYGASHSIDLERISDGSGDMVRRLLDLLSSKMASLSSREAFQDFADEMLNRIGIYRDEVETQEPYRSAMAQRVRGQKSAAPKLDTSHAKTTAIPERLVEALKNEDWIVRLQAIEQIARYPSALALNLLLEATKDSDSQVRIAALAALPDGQENPIIVDALLTALDDADYQVIDAAAERLRASEASFIPQLLKKLHGSQEYSLATIIELLGLLGDATVVAALANFIDDVREPWMWNHCIGDITVQALLTIGSPEAIQLVQESGRIAYPVLSDIIFPGSDDEPHRESLDSFHIFEELLKDLHSESWQVSQQAARQMRETAQGLKGQDNDNLAQMLSEALSDPNWVVRWTVVETLAWLHAACIIPALLLMLEDENWMVKIASIRALLELKASDVSRQIERLLFHTNSAVREAAAEALGEISDVAVLPALGQSLNDPDQFVRLAVIRAIISINDKSRVELLLEALNDSYSHVRWYAIRALAQIAEPKHLRAIVPLLRDTGKPDWEKHTISNYAELTLRRMGSPGSKKVLEKWAKVKDLAK
jgi:HEAT repeat protein